VRQVLKECMPVIPYRATNFSGQFAAVNGNHQIQASWAQLVWAAITAGKAAGDEYAYGIYSAVERLHRALMIRAYLLEAKFRSDFANDTVCNFGSIRENLHFFLPGNDAGEALCGTSVRRASNAPRCGVWAKLSDWDRKRCVTPRSYRASRKRRLVRF